MKFVRSAALVAIVASASACGGGAPAVPPMEFRLNSPAPPQSMTSVQNDNHFEAPLPPVASAPPLSTPAPPPPIASQAMPLPPQAAARAAEPLQVIAALEVPGMQPYGAPFGGQFREGETLELPLPLQPGRCYSIVGTSAGIQDLDVELAMWAPEEPAPFLAEEPSQGPTAVMGSKRMGCVRHPLPVDVPGKIIVKAARGSGLAVARVYVR